MTINRLIIIDKNLCIAVFSAEAVMKSRYWHMGLTSNKVVSLPASVTPLSPETEQGMTSTQLQDSGDQQLLDALNLISTQK